MDGQTNVYGKQKEGQMKDRDRQKKYNNWKDGYTDKQRGRLKY